MTASPRQELPYLNPKETAIAIRKLLAKSFPTSKFSVVTERGSMVSSVRVKWTDGPTTKRVESLIGCFEAGRFDGMTDSYEYDRERTVEVEGVQCRPGCRYISTTRTISPELANKCIAQIVAFWGGVEVVPVAVPGYFGHELEPKGISARSVRPDLSDYRQEWSSSIRRAAEDRTVFEREAR